MNQKVELYTGTKTYMFPNITIATPEEVLKQFPAALAFKHYVVTDENGEVMQAFENLSTSRTRYGIDPSLTTEEALAVIEEIINTPQEVDETPSADERIAAALEAQVMMSLPDETV